MEKITRTEKDQVVLSLSGGMDSSSLLLHLLVKNYKVTALSFDYGQKHKTELKKAKELVNFLNKKLKGKIDPINHKIIDISSISPLLNSSLVEGGSDVPEGHYQEDNMKDTVVPNRNKIFSSIIQAVALSLSKSQYMVKIALGIHAGDHAIYPDCRQEFRDADYDAFIKGNWDSELVTYYTPFLEGDKYDILKEGVLNCNILDIPYKEVYKRTLTSYKPYPSGNSDYKSASSIERIEAFIKLGLKDPVTYEDETGVVDWEVAKKHVERVLIDNYNKNLGNTPPPEDIQESIPKISNREIEEDIQALKEILEKKEK